MTRLEAFMRANGIKPGKLAKEACMSTYRLRRIRQKGIKALFMDDALRIRDACGRLLGRFVYITEVFEVE